MATKSVISARIDACIARTLKPHLSARGYKKAGRTFRKTNDDTIVLVQVFAGRWNLGAEGSFSIDIGVHVRPVEVLFTAVEKPSIYSCAIRTRPRHLLGMPGDWNVAIDPTQTDDMIDGAVAPVLLALDPWLERFDSLEGTLEAVDAKNLGQPYEAIDAAILELLGRRDEAIRRADERIRAARNERHRADIRAYLRRVIERDPGVR